LPAYAATLGIVNHTFVVHEAPQQIGTGTDAFHFAITSRGSAGGTNTGYAIVFSDHTPDPDRVVFALYEGHGAGGLSTRPTGCNGLGISATGRALLGRSVTVSLSGTNTDLIGMLLGVPGPALTLCSTCVIGVDMNGPLVNLPNFAMLELPIPCMHQFVGRTLTVQGYAVGSGPCRGGLRLGTSLDMTIQ
jgi:hypothetical protein